MMNITEMHNWFKLLIDKYKSPYFTDTEIDTYLNQAQSNYVNQLLFGREKTPEGIVVLSKMENSTQWAMLLYPIIKRNIAVTAYTGSILRYSDIKTSFSTQDILALLSVKDNTNKYEVEQIRYNDLGTSNRNFFTRPSTDYKGYQISDTGLVVEPSSTGEVFLVSVIRTPVSISKATSTNCELPVSTHGKIVAMAVDLAKITTEDEAYGIISNQTV